MYVRTSLAQSLVLAGLLTSCAMDDGRGSGTGLSDATTSDPTGATVNEVTTVVGSGSDTSETSGTTGTTGSTTENNTTQDPTTSGDGLMLTIDVTDGACSDLGIIGRESYAVRFGAHGPANTTVEMWAEKSTCDVTPFLFQTIELDSNGNGVFDINHPGSTDCSENLLGGWTAWLVDGDETSSAVEVLFANNTCNEVAQCELAKSYCPPEAPLIEQDQLFVLSDAERELFTPPNPDWLEWGMAYEDYPLKNLWEAFDSGTAVAPLGLDNVPNGWFEPDGSGSQNHALLWVSVAALGHGLANEPDLYEEAAGKCITLLELDILQGHMRHEALGGYAGFWEGGIATMALAGLYAPEDSENGPLLLEASRRWWNEHIAVMRHLSLPDGQVALVGARLGGETGTVDSWTSLSPAVNLQLLDPRPHSELHSTIAALVTPDGKPAAGTQGVPVVWHRPRHVAERWVFLRAIQSGALQPVPANQPRPKVVQDVYRWSEGNVVQTAIEESTGFRPARFQVRWSPGEVVTVVVGDHPDTPHTGKGPHQPMQPVNVPNDAELIVGPMD